MATAVDEQRLEIRRGAAKLRAAFGGDLDLLAHLAQGHAAVPRAKAQAPVKGLLRKIAQRAGVAARRELRRPLERLEAAGFDGIRERRCIALVTRFAAHVCAVGVHRAKFLAELEALPLLTAGPEARALEDACAPCAA